MAWTIYHKFSEKQENGNAINLNANGNLKVMLVTSLYTPAQDTDDFIDDANANEVSGTNYTAGGSVLSNSTVTLASGTVTVDGDDITWAQSGSGFTDARIAVLYEDTGTPATSQLVAYADFGADKGNQAGDLVLQLDANGVFQKTVA